MVLCDGLNFIQVVLHAMVMLKLKHTSDLPSISAVHLKCGRAYLAETSYSTVTHFPESHRTSLLTLKPSRSASAFR